ncbi:hypothetical protein O3M35_003830 [Rhynocoris fuscipes]|uniref:MATH domain-containing protein n=1 Tax=Rhynocoris fuscipes TaxID=488301 RepID=A0AAW1CHT9_9HEMI
MALLYRFVKIADRANSHVFTFVVTRSVTRDLERDVTSKEFSCGHHRWAITFSRADKVLGVYLVWRSASDSVRVYVDFTFTILNREHFSVNEAFSGKQVKFTADCPAQGNRNYIPVNDLHTRNFTDTNGEFQLELSMGHVRTVFDTEFRLPHSLFSGLNRSHHHGGTKLPTKIETTYFSFGGFDWNLALYPNGIKEQSSPKDHHYGKGDHRVSLYLNRCTGFDHQCRVRYTVVLGDGDRRIDSGIVDDVSDSDGKSYGWHPRTRFNDLVYKGVVRVHVEMILANTLSEVAGPMSMGVTAHGITHCYDRDKQGWTIKTDCHADTIRLHMVYKDIHNVPRNHLRYVSWTAYILRYHNKTVEPIPLPGAPFSHYYAQENSDEGIIMETDIGIKEFREAGCPYLSEKSQLRVQVEWEESYLLFQATYHKYDDVSRIHNYQMRKEINALQAENYSLERQLFSYQKSISYAHSRGGSGHYSDELLSPEGRDDDDRYYEDRSYSLGDRSLSTGTEYA